MNSRALLRIIDFILPVDVVLAVGLVFAMENIVEVYLTTGMIPLVWVKVYLVVLGVIGLIRVLSANEDELDDLEEDIEDL